jgi:hypothetical protein
MGRPNSGAHMDSDLSVRAWIEPDRASDDSGRAGRVGSSRLTVRLTRIDPADSDRDWIGSSRLTRIWPRCLGSGRAGQIDWLERREGEEARIPMHADWVGLHWGKGAACGAVRKGWIRILVRLTKEGAQAKELPSF